MAILKGHVKLFIIQHLACFDTPTEVVKAVKEEFGIELVRSQVALYDPTNHSGRELGVKLKKYFDNKREEFLNEINLIPISHQAYRLRSLQKMLIKAIDRNNHVLCMQLLEQAAKEVGGIYVSKSKQAVHLSDPVSEFLSTFAGGSLPIVQDIQDDYSDSEKNELDHKPRWTEPKTKH